MKQIYLDYASTTPMDPKVIRAMTPYFSKKYGNPGALHRLGQEAQAAVDESRQKIADFFGSSPANGEARRGCDFNEIIFTGSATESNNLAIRGVIITAIGQTPKQRGVRPPFVSGKPHILTSVIEHKSVLETCRDLEKQDLAEVTYLGVTKGGFVRPEDVEKSIKNNTALVSIAYANNEIGTIQPVAKIAKAICNFRNSKSQTPNSKQYPIPNTQYPILHTDAVQALNYLDCSVEKLGVDLLTFSGHKIYGPKGIGGLYIKSGTSVSPIITGGNQEDGIRSGTENVPSIVGMATAVEIVSKIQKKESVRVLKLRDYFIDEVLNRIENSQLNGARENRLPNNVNFLFKGVSANNLLIALDQAGIAASAGSTCSIKTVSASETLLAIGRTEEEAKQSVRFTLGRSTTKKDIDYTIRHISEILSRSLKQ